MTDKGKKLKPITDKNGVQTHRWATDDDDRGAANADAVKRGLAPNVSMQNDPRTGNVPLFDEDELAETEEVQAPGPPVYRTAREREIDARLDEMNKNTKDFSYVSDDGTPKTYRANVTTETVNPNKEKRQSRRSEFFSRVSSMFRRRR